MSSRRILASLIAEAVSEWQNQYEGEKIEKVKVWFVDKGNKDSTVTFIADLEVDKNL